MKLFPFRLVLVVAALNLFLNTGFGQSKAAVGFERLKSLEGKWEATGPDGQTVTVTYQVTAGGSALIETGAPANEPAMVTIYHLDGNKLVMKHYCSSGNQPYMQARTPTGDAQHLSFNLVAVTNLAKPANGHMRAVSYSFRDNDHVTQVWTWREKGKDDKIVFNLTRKK